MVNYKFLIISILSLVLQVESGLTQEIVKNKTLVVWAALDNLDQRGGSALTIDDGHGNFDGIVFGEIEKSRWMAGSNSFMRTEKDQSAYPIETANKGEFVQIVIVYEGNSIHIFREGKAYTSYEVQNQHLFETESSIIIFGLRHLEAGDQLNTFKGIIKDARIYSEALVPAQIKKLTPGSLINGPEPWAWWDFAGNGLQDVGRKFQKLKLVKGTYIDQEGLVLEGEGACLIVSKEDLFFDWEGQNQIPKSIIKDSRALRERLIIDPYRPAYHFCIPGGNGMPGDPNGAFYHNGRYHLMYLYNKEESGFCWGHVSSTDLLHWRHHPDGIGPGGGDEGCFSGGGFVDKDGTAYLTYWMLWGDKGIGMAKSTDSDFNHFQKYDTNPVIKSSEWGITEMKNNNDDKFLVGSADPSNIWENGGKYYMLTGNLLVLNKIGRNENSPENEKGDRLYLFESEDLVNWNYKHRFYESDRKWTEASEDNMCPSFFPLPYSPDGGRVSNKHLLLFISHNLGCQYYIGDYKIDHFTPEKHGRMTWTDNSYFAPEAMIDGKGRQIMWSWIFDDRPPEMKAIYGWTGTYALPRSLWLNEDGNLGIRPIEELKNLRMNEESLSNIEVKNGSEIVLNDLGSDLMELEISVEPGDVKSFSIDLCASEDGREKTVIIYNAETNKLELNTSNSSLKYGKKVIESAPFELKKDESLQLRIFIDRSIIEVFANDRQAIARRIYPTLGGKGIRFSADGGNAKILKLKRWKIAPSNPY